MAARPAILDERNATGGYRSAGDRGTAGALSSEVSTRGDTGNQGNAIGAPSSIEDLSSIQTGPSSAQFTQDKDGHDAPPTGEEELDVHLIDRLPFNIWVAVMTFSNILVLGLEQDLGPQEGGFTQRMPWYMLEVFFSINFAVEIALRIFFSSSSLLDWLFDIWNGADFILVTASVVDTLILTPMGVGGAVRLFTILRALRVVRLVRLVRMYPAFRELWLLVGGLVNSVKALAWVGLIVILVVYVAGIVVTVEIGQNHEIYNVGPSYDGEIWPYEKYFGSVLSSMFSLFQVVTLDSWCDDIVRHVVFRQPAMGFFIVVFLLFTAFGLMNIVIGIIVENTLAAAQVADKRSEEHAAWSRKQAVETLTDILVKSDSRRTGEISLAELQVAYESPIVLDLFTKIGLTLDEAQDIFGLLDYERRGRVELKRFANSCRELVGGAKRRDIAQVEITVGTLARHLEQLDGQFSKIEDEVKQLTHIATDFCQNTVGMLTGYAANLR